MERCWINQPSTMQALHKHHGKRVLVDFTAYHPLAVVYFTEGDIISIVTGRHALSPGWPKETKNAHPV